MERPRYTPPEVIPVEQVDPQNLPVDMALSREAYDDWWNNDRELQRAWDLQNAQGVGQKRG